MYIGGSATGAIKILKNISWYNRNGVNKLHSVIKLNSCKVTSCKG